MIEQLKERLSTAKKQIEARFAEVEALFKKAEADLHYLRGQHDAVSSQLAALTADTAGLAQLEQDTPPAIAATAAAVTVDSAAAGEWGGGLAADFAALQATDAAVKADAKVAADVANIADAASPTAVPN